MISNKLSLKKQVFSNDKLILYRTSVFFFIGVFHIIFDMLQVCSIYKFSFIIIFCKLRSKYIVIIFFKFYLK